MNKLAVTAFTLFTWVLVLGAAQHPAHANAAKAAMTAIYSDAAKKGETLPVWNRGGWGWGWGWGGGPWAGYGWPGRPWGWGGPYYWGPGPYSPYYSCNPYPCWRPAPVCPPPCGPNGCARPCY